MLLTVPTAAKSIRIQEVTVNLFKRCKGLTIHSSVQLYKYQALQLFTLGTVKSDSAGWQGQIAWGQHPGCCGSGQGMADCQSGRPQCSASSALQDCSKTAFLWTEPYWESVLCQDCTKLLLTACQKPLTKCFSGLQKEPLSALHFTSTLICILIP